MKKEPGPPAGQELAPAVRFSESILVSSETVYSHFLLLIKHNLYCNFVLAVISN